MLGQEAVQGAQCLDQAVAGAGVGLCDPVAARGPQVVQRPVQAGALGFALLEVDQGGCRDAGPQDGPQQLVLPDVVVVQQVAEQTQVAVDLRSPAAAPTGTRATAAGARRTSRSRAVWTTTMSRTSTGGSPDRSRDPPDRSRGPDRSGPAGDVGGSVGSATVGAAAVMAASVTCGGGGDHPSNLGFLSSGSSQAPRRPHDGWMGSTTRRALADRLRDTAGTGVDLPALARGVCQAVERSVPFAFACFATTDPTTGLITWAWKTRSLGVGDEDFAAAEYGPADVNSFAEIARRRPPVGVLSLDTGGHLDTCRRHRDFLHPRFGFTDELRAVFLSRAASWGAVALYRGPGDPPFTATDADQLAAVSELVAQAIQQSLFRLDPGPRAAGAAVPAVAGTGGPAVLVIDPAGQVTQLTPGARAAVDELGGWDHGSLPSTVLAVVAATRTHGGHTETRAQGISGRWLSLRAAPLVGPDGPGDIVVTIEATPLLAMSRLALTAHGLTTREEDVALLVLQGADTRAVATALHLSPYTVQDHLKTVFTKLGVTSRREMTARLVVDRQ